MYIRDPSSVRSSGARTTAKPSKKKRSISPVFLMLIALIGALGWLFLGTTHASAIGSPIKSGWSGYCLDNYRSKDTAGNQVDLWPCNNSGAQDWQISLTQISRADNLCLTADSKTNITIETCNQSPNQVWLKDDSGLLNPGSGRCLTAESASQGQQLTLATCSSLTSDTQKWTPNISYSTIPCTGSQGQTVACFAVKQWINWTTEPNNQENLLTAYTGGAPYEEWCADFVSYIYREAGYPFSNGNYDGWDENIASDIVDQGFSVQQSPNYIPQPGDIAYFNYPGGHVEIVVVGGKKPTFIYGNSATIDPITDNGQMAANTLESVSGLGSLQYYMSPNSST